MLQVVAGVTKFTMSCTSAINNNKRPVKVNNHLWEELGESQVDDSGGSLLTARWEELKEFKLQSCK